MPPPTRIRRVATSKDRTDVRDRAAERTHGQARASATGGVVTDSRPASIAELYGMPGHLIRRAQQVSGAIFAEECGGFDLTSVQYAALVAIAASPHIDATRLSAAIAFDRSTIGDVIERLEGKGWVVRSGSPHDKRVKLLDLTPEGLRVLREVGPAVRRVQDRLLLPLGAADRAAMVMLLTRLVDLHNDPVPASVRAAE